MSIHFKNNAIIESKIFILASMLYKKANIENLSTLFTTQDELKDLYEFLIQKIENRSVSGGAIGRNTAANLLEKLSEFYRRTKELKEYVNSKYNELHGNNSDYLSYSKYGQQVIHLEYILSKILLVTTSAGQGKTNLICDIVDNVLLKRGIPFVYMNGYEIDSNNIGESFARMMLPMSKASFDESIKGLSTYCKYKRCPVILIIDGLNENPNPETFSRNLQVFLDAVLQYDCVKVIMTCRTEYYKECFTTFDDAFKDKMIKIGDLNKHLDEDERGRLLDNYLRYFKITAQFGHHVQERLCDDLLLLRIFCEANRNKNLGVVHSIKREELFTEYYDIMTRNLIEKVQKEEGYKLSENRVKDFITSLIDYMISNGMFFILLSYYIIFRKMQYNDNYQGIFCLNFYGGVRYESVF